MTPLAWHAYGGNNDIVSLLLESGADINVDIDASRGDAKITAMDIASGLIAKQAKDGHLNDSFMQTFLTLKNTGGLAYRETKAGKAELATKAAKEELATNTGRQEL